MRDPADDFTPIEVEFVRRARDIGFGAAEALPDMQCGLALINATYATAAPGTFRRNDLEPSKK